MEWQTTSRSELYDQVWNEPLTRLAQKFGLSDVGLAKLLKKHDIPHPPRGYWAKLRFGHSPERMALPNPKDNSGISMREPVVPSEPVRRTELEEELATWEVGAAKISVASTLRGAHSLVSRARDAFEKAEKDEIGFLQPAKENVLNLAVSKGTLRRSLLMVDALLKAFERHGYPVAAGPSVTVLGETVKFGMEETVESKREAIDGEHDLDGPYQFGHSRYFQKRIPSGRLVLRITSADAYWAEGSRKMWRDAKSPLEERLTSFVQGVVKIAAILKKHKARQAAEAKVREAKAERQAEEARLRAEKLARIKTEQKRVRDLFVTVKNWQRSQALREYIASAREYGAAKCGEHLEEDAYVAWLAWATAQADRLDPFCESPPSILDENVGRLVDSSPRRPHS